MRSETIFFAVLILVAVERVFELAIARRHAQWSFARGGREYCRGHYPALVVLHTGLLIGAGVEVWFVPRVFSNGLGWTMAGFVAATQILRYWCIASLGKQWNTRVIVVPGLQRVMRGPYRWLRHPNYVAVVIEGIALPLIHGAWITATVFTAANLPVLARRVACEERALAAHLAAGPPTSSGRSPM